MVTDAGFSLISGFTKMLCSPENPLYLLHSKYRESYDMFSNKLHTWESVAGLNLLNNKVVFTIRLKLIKIFHYNQSVNKCIYTFNLQIEDMKLPHKCLAQTKKELNISNLY